MERSQYEFNLVCTLSNCVSCQF